MKTSHPMIAFLLASLLSCSALADDVTRENAALIQNAFNDQRAGQGGIFQLLADDVVWGVAGNSPVSGTYRSREQFMAEAVNPITDELATPIVPSVRQIVAQGSLVVAYWDGQATAKDGSRYTNSYSWHMQLKNGRITHVTAFLDTWRLVELMN